MLVLPCPKPCGHCIYTQRHPSEYGFSLSTKSLIPFTELTSAAHIRPLPPASPQKISTLEADKQALLRRSTEAEESTARRRRQAEEARDRLQDALEEVSKFTEACAGKDRVALEARAEAKHAAERLATEWGREKAELKASNEALVKRIVSVFFKAEN